ncbi:MAG: hypothetical protein PHS44_00315 [Candidatus Dojkabacteria bacterium]|nr:hypothetical protein [Candidatus Dojkabacteria bacterium]
MKRKHYQDGNTLIMSSAISGLGIALFTIVFTQFSYPTDYFPFLLFFLISLLFWIIAILFSYKWGKTGLAIFPAFILTNALGVFGLLIFGARLDLVGYCFLANIFIYTLLSLYVFNGKFTQITILWAVLSMIVLSLYSGIDLVLILISLGLGALGVNFMIRATNKIWQSLPEKELVNVIADIKKTNYIYLVAAISLSLFLLLIRVLKQI